MKRKKGNKRIDKIRQEQSDALSRLCGLREKLAKNKSAPDNLIVRERFALYVFNDHPASAVNPARIEKRSK